MPATLFEEVYSMSVIELWIRRQVITISCSVFPKVSEYYNVSCNIVFLKLQDDAAILQKFGMKKY